MNGRRIKKVMFILIACVFAAGVIYSERSNITVFSFDEPSAIYSVQTDKKMLALTFDISWGDTRTEPILKVLQDKGVKKATFFLSAPWSESHPDIVKKIVDAGYEIGSHGFKHVNYSTLSEEEIRREIQTAHSILQQVTGKSTNLIRLPNGDFDKRVLRIADELNYRVIQWDVDSLDWMTPGVDQIISNVTKKAKNGSIVLLHASDSARQTHEALPAIIDNLRGKGFDFATVSELIYQTGMETNEVRDNRPQ
jgi:polysaccharide deacetylase family sporulation protein PdaB